MAVIHLLKNNELITTDFWFDELPDIHIWFSIAADVSNNTSLYNCNWPSNTVIVLSERIELPWRWQIVIFSSNWQQFFNVNFIENTRHGSELAGKEVQKTSIKRLPRQCALEPKLPHHVVVTTTRHGLEMRETSVLYSNPTRSVPFREHSSIIWNQCFDTYISKFPNRACLSTTETYDNIWNSSLS